MYAKLEVSAYSVQWAVDAQKAGADRVELCANLYEGGTTPSYAAIELARKYLDIELYVIIRPRGGDFLYSDIEFETMKRDIIAAKKLGVDGLVLGILNIDGSIDKKCTKELVELSAPLPVTFHRAFDVAKNPFQALEDIIETGCERILTSGQKATAFEGLNLIADLVQKANKRISIMPGSGINESNIQEIQAKSKAFEFHLSGKKILQSPMKYLNKEVSFNALNSSPVPEYQAADINRIRKVCNLLKNK